MTILVRIVSEFVDTLQADEGAISEGQLKSYFSHLPKGELEWSLEKLKADGIVKDEVDNHGDKLWFLADEWVENNWNDIYGDAGVLV
jgi:hypothetical protein